MRYSSGDEDLDAWVHQGDRKSLQRYIARSHTLNANLYQQRRVIQLETLPERPDVPAAILTAFTEEHNQ
jgi:hypothetical protein